MVRLSPKRTANLRLIRQAITAQLESYNEDPARIEVSVAKQMADICKLPNSKVRQIARSL